MRITGGEFRGRRLKVPRGRLRPTTDRVREALFASLGGNLEGERVLDLYAGTGAWGMEARSRGASSVTWVEQDRRIYRVLTDNVATVCGDDPASLRLVCMDALRFFSRGNPRRDGYHLVIADPPYDRDGTSSDRLEKLLQALANGPMLTRRGRFVMEQWAEEPVVTAHAWDLAWNRVYGETRLLVYRPG